MRESEREEEEEEVVVVIMEASAADCGEDGEGGCDVDAARDGEAGGEFSLLLLSCEIVVVVVVIVVVVVDVVDDVNDTFCDCRSSSRLIDLSDSSALEEPCVLLGGGGGGASVVS